jgi:hypothetical protein
MNVDTSAPETSGTRGPSPSFLKRRHERMRNRLNSPESKEEEGRNLVDDSIPAIEVTLSGPRSSTASSAAVRSFRQLREKRKKRVPGGAAAKLIGKTYTEDIEEGPQGDEGETKEADADDDEEEVAVPTDEFIKIRDEAKDAFEKGTKNNRRYYETTPTAPEAPKEDVDARRAVNLEQGLHETPTAAVLSLLNGGETPKTSQGKTVGKSKCFPDGIPSVSSNWSIEQTPPPKDFTQTPAIEVTPRNAFQAPPRKDEHQNAGSDENSTSKLTISAVTSEEMERTTKGRNPLEQPLLSKKAEQRVAQMRDRMQDPSSTLADLIATIATPEDKTMSRGYMVRRKNACGALQVMTAKKTNRIPICWTLGVLPALSSVLEDSGTRDLAVEFQDVPTRKEFLEARKRAVGTLMNLSAPQENRIPVFHTPKMVVNLVQVIKLDQYEARKGCCAILAQLAKSKENRLLMVQVPGLIDEITSIIEPNVIIVPPKPISEDEEDDVSSSRTPDQEFADRNSSSEDETNETRSRGPFRSESFESTDVEISYKKEKEEDGKYKVDVSAVPTHDPAKAAKRYDEGPNEYLQGARLNVFALLSHLVKEKDNAVSYSYKLCPNDDTSSLAVSHQTPSHSHHFLARSLNSIFLLGTNSWSILWLKFPSFTTVRLMSTL